MSTTYLPTYRRLRDSIFSPAHQLERSKRTMTANPEQDAFGRLPEELRITIIKLAPDALSLRNLAHASPAMGRVLDRYALEIAEAVLYAIVPVQTRRLMSAVLQARFARFPACLCEAQKVAKTDSTVASDEMRSRGADRAAAAAAVRSLLATADKVHAWSHAYLEHLIRKSMELRPATLVEKGPGRTSREQFENAKSRSDYLPQCTGPPSWIEEQRMIKSFWRLQFFLELQGAADEGRLDAYWLGQEVEALTKTSSPDGFYDMLDFEREQTLTACDFFNAVTSGSIPSLAAIPDNASRLPGIHWTKGPAPKCPCPEAPSFKPNQDIFFQGPKYLDTTPMSCRFQHIMAICDQFEDAGPALLVFPFQPWRKYGFAIWDCKRMADLGMRDPRGKSFLRDYARYAFRWFSVLTEEDLRAFP